MLLFITLQMVFLTCDRCVEFHAQVCLTYRAQEKNKREREKERKKERKKEKNLTFCLSCKLTLGKYIWLSYYRLLPGSHSLFIRMMCLNPCPALFSCWKLFWAQQENLLILDCYRMGLFSCPCILC